MLNSKLDHRKEYFFRFIGFGLKVLKPLSQFSISLKKLDDDFKINLHTADFSMAGFIARATWNRVPWKLHYTQLVEQLSKFVSQQLKCKINWG